MAAFGVAPGPEILHVEIAHHQHVRRARKRRAHQGPQLRPPVKRGSQEGEYGFGHVPVF